MERTLDPEGIHESHRGWTATRVATDRGDQVGSLVPEAKRRAGTGAVLPEGAVRFPVAQRDPKNLHHRRRIATLLTGRSAAGSNESEG